MIGLGSQLRRRLLAYYFTNPGSQHYLREIAAVLGLDPTNLLRELRRLEHEGLFVSERRGRQAYFRLNRSYPLYREVRGIVSKTLGVPVMIREALETVPGIEEAYLYGSFARDQEDAASDIDLLVVGRARVEQLEIPIRSLERQLGREINYTLLSPEEFRLRRTRRDAFLEDVWRRKRIPVAGPR